MYRYTIIAVGKMKNRALAELCEDYGRRLARQGGFECIELKDGTIAAEARRIREALAKRPGARVYALAEEGRSFTSRGLASELGALEGAPAIFVVGGAYGLDATIKEAAHCRWSLSALTFTHEIARMVLAEQLYRAVSIQSGSKYHHD
jgi:23S rRNA (pseudouridine1915-N3)-methyltransferase